MGYKITTEADKLIITSIIWVLFGEAGIGKTSLSFTSNAPLLEDYDGGLHRAVNRKTAIEFDKWEDAVKFHSSGELEKMEIKTLIIDTAGTLLDNSMAQAVIRENGKNAKSNGQLSLQGYGALKNTFQQFVAWAKAKKIDIIFVCHSEQFKDGDDIKYRPKMTGGSYDILIANADMVGFIKSANNKRTISFTPSDQHVGKNTAEFPVIELPHYNEPEFKTFAADLIEKTKQKMMSMSEAQQKSLDRIISLKKDIEDCTEYDKLQKILPKLDKLEKVEKIQVEKLIDSQIKLIVSASIEEAKTVVNFNAILDIIRLQPKQRDMWNELLAKSNTLPKVEFNTENKSFVKTVAPKEEVVKKETPKVENPKEEKVEEVTAVRAEQLTAEQAIKEQEELFPDQQF